MDRTIWVRLCTNPTEYERADYFREHVLAINTELLKAAQRWIAQGKPEQVRTFGRSFGVFYGLPWKPDHTA